MSDYRILREDELKHYGIKGMKWGHRKRYYNSDGSLTKSGTKRYYKEMHRDMQNHFKSQIKNKKARDTVTIGRNGYDIRGEAWNKAYKKKQVTSKDDANIKKAASETRTYMKKKYGEKYVKNLAKTGFLNRTIPELDDYRQNISLDELLNRR